MTAHIPVFFEGQDDLADTLAVSMVSICYNTKSAIDFYILDCGLNNLNKRLLYKSIEQYKNASIEFISIDLKRFSHLKGYTKNNYVDCYSRLLIPELKPDIDKAIYLDNDIMALGDIALLWQEDLDGFELAACADCGYTLSIQKHCMRFGIPQNQIYCNAGVLIIDCAKWRQNDVSNKLLRLAEIIKNDISLICEDLLNLYYKDNNYKLLDLRYNIHQLEENTLHACALQITADYVNKEWRNAVIQHFSPLKPWKDRNIKNGGEFWFFAQMTPFGKGLEIKLLNSLFTPRLQKNQYKLFGIIPLLSSRQKAKYTHYYLFGILPVMKKKES